MVTTTRIRVGVAELIAAGYVPGAPDDDPRVPGRTGTTYVIGGGAHA